MIRDFPFDERRERIYRSVCPCWRANRPGVLESRLPARPLIVVPNRRRSIKWFQEMCAEHTSRTLRKKFSRRPGFRPFPTHRDAPRRVHGADGEFGCRCGRLSALAERPIVLDTSTDIEYRRRVKHFQEPGVATHRVIAERVLPRRRSTKTEASLSQNTYHFIIISLSRSLWTSTGG